VEDVANSANVSQELREAYTEEAGAQVQDEGDEISEDAEEPEWEVEELQGPTDAEQKGNNAVADETAVPDWLRQNDSSFTYQSIGTGNGQEFRPFVA